MLTQGALKLRDPLPLADTYTFGNEHIQHARLHRDPPLRIDRRDLPRDRPLRAGKSILKLDDHSGMLVRAGGLPVEPGLERHAMRTRTTTSEKIV